MAYDRLALVFVIAYGLHDTGFFTTAAADTLLRVQRHAPSLAESERAGRADLGAVRFPAGVAHRRHEFSRHSAVRPDMDAAFPDGMVLTVDHGADKHTGKAPEAFVHLIRFYYLCQTIFPQIRHEPLH